VPSSISSSSPAHWATTWLLTTLLLGVGLGVWELFLDNRGYRPSVHDTLELWSSQRALLDGGCANSIALLGASRMLLDLDIATLRERYPNHGVAQLGVNGHYPLATLRDLAESGFSGIVLVSMTAQSIEPAAVAMQQPQVDFFHQQSTLNGRTNARLRAQLEHRVIAVQPALSLIRLLELASWPAIPYVVGLPDRSLRGDYQLVDTRQLREHFVQLRKEVAVQYPATPPEKWLGLLPDLKHWVQAIQSRGGKVALLRLPTSGEHWELDQRQYPRTSYWDQLAARTGAVTVHFADVEALQAFELPDGSHIDYRDSPAFTNPLLDHLVELKVLPGEGPNLADLIGAP
jgi:hypothetical protein